MKKDKQDRKRKQNSTTKQTVVRKPIEAEMTDEELTKVAGGGNGRRTSGLA